MSVPDIIPDGLTFYEMADRLRAMGERAALAAAIEFVRRHGHTNGVPVDVGEGWQFASLPQQESQQ